MENMEQLQVVVSEIQSTRQQMATVNAQILELEATSQAVSNQPEDLALHQQLGGVLIEVSDRKALLEVLAKDVETLKSHMERLQNREVELVSSYEELKEGTRGI